MKYQDLFSARQKWYEENKIIEALKSWPKPKDFGYSEKEVEKFLQDLRNKVTKKELQKGGVVECFSFSKQPLPGDSITTNGETYTFRLKGIGKNVILIGKNVQETIKNMADIVRL